MDKVSIYKELIELSEKKDEHFKQSAEYYANLAKNKESQIFMTGCCDKCDELDKQISDLEKELKTLL